MNIDVSSGYILRVFGCRKCGRIWAPLNNPVTCPCGHATQAVSVASAMRLAAARQRKLRERADERAAARRRHRAHGRNAT